MKKLWILAVIVMMMAFVTAVQAEVRAGGLPTITVDKKIKDCDCRMFPSCCAQPVVAPGVPNQLQNQHLLRFRRLLQPQ